MLLACLAFAITPAAAAEPDTWVPVQWQGGPLEVERRTRAATLPDVSALQESLRQWDDPATLDLLRGTPINCLLVTWSAGGDPATERAQQQLVTTYARAARSRGIAVLGLIHRPDAPSSSLAAAVDADLDGLLLEGDHNGPPRSGGPSRNEVEESSWSPSASPWRTRCSTAGGT